MSPSTIASNGAKRMSLQRGTTPQNSIDDNTETTVPSPLTLDQAIRNMDHGKNPKYSQADIAKIHAIAEELGVSEFKEQPAGQYFSDLNGQVHVHPTMVVTATRVAGSTRTDTYKQLPFRVELSRWNDKTPLGQTRQLGIPMCQECFNPLDDGHVNGCY